MHRQDTLDPKIQSALHRVRSRRSAGFALGAVGALLTGACGRTAPEEPFETCVDPLLWCEEQDRCVDPQWDPQACGACDVRCSTGQLCDEGRCVVHCAEGRAACAGEDGTTRCVSVASDHENCGACGRACPAAATCSEGQCLCGGLPCCGDGPCPLACKIDEMACSDGDGTTRCVSVASDHENCGACGHVCPAAAICSEGQCLCAGGPCCGDGPCSACGADEMSCPDATGSLHCVAVMSDRENCGGCGRTCPDGATCAEGQCLCGGVPCCPDSLLSCETVPGERACIDPATNDQHCGACGKECGSGRRCVAGTCQDCAPRHFHAPLAYEAGPQRGSANEGPLVEDLDGDGITDIAVASSDGSSVLIYRGLGDGRLEEPVERYTFPLPSRPAVADLGFSSDERELIVAGSGGYVIYVGTTWAPRIYGFETDWEERLTTVVQAANFFGDERLELLLVSTPRSEYYGPQESRFWIAEGFDLSDVPNPVLIHTTKGPVESVQVEDLNGDGALDIAVLQGDVDVLWGSATGTWTPEPGWIRTGNSDIDALHLTDVNHDGITDLFASHAYGEGTLLYGYYLRTFLSNAAGDRELLPAPEESFTSSFDPITRFVDLDRDGVTDLLSRESAATSLNTYRGAGDGTFAHIATSPIPPSAVGMETGDLNGDGTTDLIALHDEAEAFTVHLGSSDGSFDSYIPVLPEETYLRGAQLRRYADRPEPLVAVVGGLDEGTFRVLRYTPENQFALEQEVPIYRPQSLRLGDVDGDGHPDALIPAESKIHCVRYEGGGRFSSTVETILDARGTVAGVGDLDGDARPEVVLEMYPASSTGENVKLRVMSRTEDGSWAMKAEADVPQSNEGIITPKVAVGELTGDGVDDVVVMTLGDSVNGPMLRLWPGRRDGAFEMGAEGELPNTWYHLLLTDLDGDGVQEIVAGDWSGYHAFQWDGEQAPRELGGAARPILYDPGPSNRYAFSEDIDGDSRADIIESPADGRLVLWSGDGRGGFTEAETYLAPGAREAVGIEDLDGDGLRDLLLIGASNYNGSLLVLKGAARCE